MINAPLRFDYQEMKDAWGPYVTTSVPTTQKDTVFNGVMNIHLTTGPDVFAEAADDGIYGIGYGPITFYAATGLASSDENTFTLTVETRTCVEYTLAYTSASIRFASLPPPERPLAIRAAHDLGRLIPSSVPTTPEMESQGFLSRFWEWYWPKEKAAVIASWRTGAAIANQLAGGIPGLIGGMGNMSLGGGQRLALGY